MDGMLPDGNVVEILAEHMGEYLCKEGRKEWWLPKTAVKKL